MDSLTVQVLQFLCSYKEYQKKLPGKFRVINADVVKAFETAGLTRKEKRLLLGLIRTEADFKKVKKRRDYEEIRIAGRKLAGKLIKLGRNQIPISSLRTDRRTGRVEMDYPKHKRKKWGVKHVW